jgi:hydroxymethylglutaryl-CoA lyase
VITTFPEIETGVHLHSTNRNWQQKIDAALQNGCMRYDGALKGFGGCPFAEDTLVGNMNTELMIPYFKKLGFLENINESELLKAGKIAAEIFI